MYFVGNEHTISYQDIVCEILSVCYDIVCLRHPKRYCIRNVYYDIVYDIASIRSDILYRISHVYYIVWDIVYIGLIS